jgi:hypothetical protein
MKHIVDYMKKHLGQVFDPILEELEIYGAMQLEEICPGPLAPNSFGKLTVIKVTNCKHPCVVGCKFSGRHCIIK